MNHLDLQACLLLLDTLSVLWQAIDHQIRSCMCKLSDKRVLLPNAFQSRLLNFCACFLNINLVLAAPTTVACQLPLAHPLCWLYKKKLWALGQNWIEQNVQNVTSNVHYCSRG